MKKTKVADAILVIMTGFIVLYLLYGRNWLLYVALGAGLSAIFIQPLAKLIAKFWYKLGDVMGFVVSKIVLAVLFYFLLAPIAILHNFFNKDVLNLKRRNSGWSNRNHLYSAKDLKNPF